MSTETSTEAIPSTTDHSSTEGMGVENGAEIQANEVEIEAEVRSAFPDTFYVCDASTANWVARKIVESRLHRERVKAWADREVLRSERLESRLWYLYEGQLREWVQEAVRKLGGRRRSVDLPDARVGF